MPPGFEGQTGGVTPETADVQSNEPGGFNPLALLAWLFDTDDDGKKSLSNAGKVVLGTLGTGLAANSGGQSQASKDAQDALTRAADAQASDVEANVRRKQQLEDMIKGLQPLTGDQKNELIRLRPGKQTDFSNVASTGGMDRLFQLAGLGSQSGLVGQAGVLGAQQDMFGQQRTSDAVQSLVELLLGLGGGGQ